MGIRPLSGLPGLRYDRPRSVAETRNANLELAHAVHAYLGEGPYGDHQVLDRAREVPAIRAYLATGGGPAQLQTLAHYRWADAGFPVVSLGHKYAAALLVTSASDEAIEICRPPFPAFYIEVPEGLIQCREANGELADIRSVLVVKTESLRTGLDWAWGYITCSALGTTLYRFGVRSPELLPPRVAQADDEEIQSWDAFRGKVTDIDERAMALIGRLIVNVSLSFSDPTNVTPPKNKSERHRINSAFKGRQEPFPTARVYVLARPVRHDFRERVRQYMAGSSRSTPNVQVLVAGHHKMQAHGINHSLRKLVWIEPYWRGPEDAPIAVRPHKLIDKEEGK